LRGPDQKAMRVGKGSIMVRGGWWRGALFNHRRFAAAIVRPGPRYCSAT